MKKPAAPTVPVRARPPPPGCVPVAPAGPPAPPPLGVEETARSREGSLLKEGFNALVGLVVGSGDSSRTPPRPVVAPPSSSADDGLFAPSQADFGSDEGFQMSAPVIRTQPPRKTPSHVALPRSVGTGRGSDGETSPSMLAPPSEPPAPPPRSVGGSEATLDGGVVAPAPSPRRTSQVLEPRRSLSRATGAAAAAVAADADAAPVPVPRRSLSRATGAAAAAVAADADAAPVPVLRRSLSRATGAGAAAAVVAAVSEPNMPAPLPSRTSQSSVPRRSLSRTTGAAAAALAAKPELTEEAQSAAPDAAEPERPVKSTALSSATRRSLHEKRASVTRSALPPADPEKAAERKALLAERLEARKQARLSQLSESSPRTSAGATSSGPGVAAPPPPMAAASTVASESDEQPVEDAAAPEETRQQMLERKRAALAERRASMAAARSAEAAARSSAAADAAEAAAMESAARDAGTGDVDVDTVVAQLLDEQPEPEPEPSPEARIAPQPSPRTSPQPSPRTSPRASPRSSPHSTDSPRASPRPSLTVSLPELETPGVAPGSAPVRRKPVLTAQRPPARPAGGSSSVIEENAGKPPPSPRAPLRSASVIEDGAKALPSPRAGSPRAPARVTALTASAPDGAAPGSPVLSSGRPHTSPRSSAPSPVLPDGGDMGTPTASRRAAVRPPAGAAPQRPPLQSASAGGRGASSPALGEGESPATRRLSRPLSARSDMRLSLSDEDALAAIKGPLSPSSGGGGGGSPKRSSGSSSPKRSSRGKLSPAQAVVVESEEELYGGFVSPKAIVASPPLSPAASPLALDLRGMERSSASNSARTLSPVPAHRGFVKAQPSVRAREARSEVDSNSVVEEPEGLAASPIKSHQQALLEALVRTSGTGGGGSGGSGSGNGSLSPGGSRPSSRRGTFLSRRGSMHGGSAPSLTGSGGDGARSPSVASSFSVDADALRRGLDELAAVATRPLDVRSMKVSVIAMQTRFDYQADSAYTAYFVHVCVADEVYTVTRRIRDVTQLHKGLLKRYAARLLPKLDVKEKKEDAKSRAALQAYLQSLIETRFVAETPEFVHFFRDVSSETAPLLVRRCQTLPLSEALLLLGASVTDVELRREAVKRLRQEGTQALLTLILFLVTALQYEQEPLDSSPLFAFLLDTAAKSDEFAVLLHWHLVVERGDVKGAQSALYGQALKLLAERLSAELNRCTAMQTSTMRRLVEVVQSVANSKRDRLEKIDRLRFLLSGSVGDPLRTIDPPVLFPIAPYLKTSGIVAETATLYKSALLPLGLEWRVEPTDESSLSLTDEGANTVVKDGVMTKKIIFKAGDDLRQDQMVTSFVRLMASMFRAEGLDMRMCTYRVLATGRSEGLIEVVPNAHNVAAVLEDFPQGGLQMFFMHHNRSVTAHTTSLENYIRSCAGYIVVTFFLGVGDRHLDNILVTEDGRLFHVDFGFILGADPKPLPPLVRLTKEMVEGMGGFQSSGYDKLLLHCVNCYRILRRCSPLLLAAFGLAGESVSNPRAFGFLYQRLRLDLDDDAASAYLKDTINQSCAALFPQLMEKIHSAAQAKRK